jgi:protein TonB
MFADSLLNSAYGNRSHRGWATLASFAVQALAVGTLLLLPLIHPQGLPNLKLLSWSGPTLAPPPASPPRVLPHSASTSASNLAENGQIIQPRSIPRTIQQITDVVPPPPVDRGGAGVDGGTGTRGGVLSSVVSSIGDAMRSAAPPTPTVTRPPRVSRMMEGNLIYRLEPRYPPLAIQTRIQGDVVLQAVISRFGTIENLQLVSGPPMLVRAAMDAVQQWRYRPYVLNGEPIEVETQVTVKFILNN